MKKKGTSAGIPRGNGERPSPVGNGVPNNQVRKNLPDHSLAYPRLSCLSCRFFRAQNGLLSFSRIERLWREGVWEALESKAQGLGEC